MIRLLPLSIALGVLVTPPLLKAAVFQRDWKTPGDGLLTYDDVNKREWLDLSQSALSQFPTPRLANALAEIGLGGLFQGFTLANRMDVLALASSAGIDVNTTVFAHNFSPTSHLIALLSSTLHTSQTVRTLGYLRETDAASRQLGADVFVETPSGGNPAAGVEIPANRDIIGRTTTGLFLYRVVPEPSSGVQIVSAMLVGCSRRRRAGIILVP